MQNTVLLVIHIPKAAGSTLRWILDRQYPTGTVYRVQGSIVGDAEIREDILRDSIRRQKLRVIFGHFCYGLHTALLPKQEFSYITILRDPVQRLVSLYSYIRYASLDHYLHSIVSRMSFVDFVQSGVAMYTDNGQVRQLCGLDRFTMEQGKQIPYRDMVIPFGSVTGEHLEAAKGNLSTFACVGVSEQFESFLDCVQAKYTWRIPLYQNKNVTRKKVQVSNEELDIARKMNILDYELYEYAKSIAQGEHK